MPELIAKKCSTPVMSLEEVKQQQLPLCNHGMFSSTPSPSPELSIIKLEHFSKGVSCLCLNAGEWSPVVLVLSSEAVWAGECQQVGVEVAGGETWARSIALGGQLLGSGRESATITCQTLMFFFP